MAAPSSSVPVPFFGISREEDQNHEMTRQHSSTSTPNSSSLAPAPPPQKKRRNQPGTPNPDAEVIALSPKTLMATNRFICEVCNKGFQREQNLQLHRRGHNLPWKLRQKTTKEVKRKVYLCPEPTCVHHEPSRALGDLTGIKKHYSRKHGEKKWKCEKCSKRYAVQSDWKAHSKTCGTREYRCDCGTLFSRRDSFVTHRAFCDALAQESGRNPPAASLSTIGSHLYGNNNNTTTNMNVGFSSSQLQNQTSHVSDILRLGGDFGRTGGRFDHILPPSMGSSSSPFRAPQQQPLSSSPFFMQETNQSYHHEGVLSHQSQPQSTKQQPFHGLMQFPPPHDLETNTNNTNLFHLSFISNFGSSTTSNTNNSNNNINGVPSSGLLVSDHFNAQNDNAVDVLIGGDHHQISSAVPSLFSSSSFQNANVMQHMSATALLQKAAQMGSSTTTTSPSNNNNERSSPLLMRSFVSSSSSNTTSGSGAKNERSSPSPLVSANFGGLYGESLNHESHLQDLMNSFAAASGNSSIFGENPFVPNYDPNNNKGGSDQEKHNVHVNVSSGGSDRLTRDFLGVGQIVKGASQHIQQQQQHGMEMGSSSSTLNLEGNNINISPPARSQSFGGANNNFQ
ncbi:zinc finger protein NUTCRACKER-like [Tripterygium wilfordii]|uniref:Zinc finger protein NUTCRACKER-like n=1 Tax=Tripterygium wilfordii TaxID=458696 RepID=A0A7J7CUQ0_TRIWF|nr:protein indeterminate-domain 5, chloroplastic-like [Tripterygium wilfordii]KAF5737793.1 zinc finger protein NUTCRACKER-like [Tripterygium wilfordii]